HKTAGARFPPHWPSRISTAHTASGGRPMINRFSLALVLMLTAALAAPADGQQPAVDTKTPKGVKARNLVTSLGGFTATVNDPLLVTGQAIELEPGGH